MSALLFTLGSVLGALGVALGAFGAHGLKSRVDPDLLAIFETGARYHLVHALAILAAAWAVDRWPGAWATAAGWLFAAGIGRLLRELVRDGPDRPALARSDHPRRRGLLHRRVGRPGARHPPRRAFQF